MTSFANANNPTIIGGEFNNHLHVIQVQNGLSCSAFYSIRCLSSEFLDRSSQMARYSQRASCPRSFSRFSRTSRPFKLPPGYSQNSLHKDYAACGQPLQSGRNNMDTWSSGTREDCVCSDDGRLMLPVQQVGCKFLLLAKFGWPQQLGAVYNNTLISTFVFYTRDSGCHCEDHGR